MSDVLIMNKAHMDGLQTAFTRNAEAVEALIRDLNGVLANTTWDGSRARRFRDEWNSHFQPNLRQLQKALGENATFIGKEKANAMTAMD